MVKTFITSGGEKMITGRMPCSSLFYIRVKNKPISVSYPLCKAGEPHDIGQFTYQHNTSDTTWFQGFLLIQQIS